MCLCFTIKKHDKNHIVLTFSFECLDVMFLAKMKPIDFFWIGFKRMI